MASAQKADIHPTDDSLQRSEKAEVLPSYGRKSPVDMTTTDDKTALPALENQPTVTYHLYKRRFLGLISVFILNFIAGMIYPWFGPIATPVSEDFHISLSRVNWLSTAVQIGIMVSVAILPPLCGKFGLRICFLVGEALLILSAWIRYAGTASSLSTEGAYALLMLSQIISAFSQAFFLFLAPLFSETWFGPKERTTATMFMSIANSFGAAMGLIISPRAGSPRHAILVLAIMCTVTLPFALIMGDKPPTPPSLAGSRQSPPVIYTLRALIGTLPKPNEGEKVAPNDIRAMQMRACYMTPRERLDLLILILTFCSSTGISSSFAVLSSEILNPYGYPAKTGSLMGSALLIAGIVSAVLTAPVFDRIITKRHALVIKAANVVVAVCWFSMIWAVRRNNTAAMVVVVIICGACSMAVLPITLEMGVELTRNAHTSSSMLWAMSSLLAVVFIWIAVPMQASATSDPPLNMRPLLIFYGALSLTMTACMLLFFRGKQVRREADEKAQEMAAGRAVDQ